MSFKRQVLALALEELGLEVDVDQLLRDEIPHTKFRVQRLEFPKFLEYCCCARGGPNYVEYHRVLLSRKDYRNGTKRECLLLWIGQCERCGVVIYTTFAYNRSFLQTQLERKEREWLKSRFQP